MSDTNKKTSFIADFAIVRKIIYQYFLYGCKSSDDFEKLDFNRKMYNIYKNKISAYINEDKHVNENKSGRKKIITYKMDSYTIHHNYLCNAYKMSSDFSANIAGQLVLVMQQLSDDSLEGIGISEINKKLQALNLSEDIDFRGFVNDGKYGAIPKLINLNLVRNVSSNKTPRYVRQSNPLSNVNISVIEFLDFINICRNITPPYTAGDMMFETSMDYFRHKKQIDYDYKTPFIIKGDFFSQVLDDNIFYDLINIMSKKQSSEIVYKRTNNDDSQNRIINVFPIKLITNINDGRRYLFAWDIKHDKVTFMRTDKIISVSSIGEMPECLNSIDLEELYLSSTKYSLYGTTLLNQDKEEPEKIKISFVGSTNNDKNEDFKRQAIRLFNNTEFFKTDDNQYSGDIYVNSFKELKPWLRENVGYVKLTDSESPYTSEMDEEIKEWKKLYGII